MNKINASIMLGSYFETVGFKNGEWEFNYSFNIKDFDFYISLSNTLLNHFMILGGPHHINISNWNSSDDTILLIATMKAVKNGGGIKNYTKEYINIYNLLKDEKRAAGITTLNSIRSLQLGIPINISKTMGGNGCALRTPPIGLIWYNDYEKVIKESIIASILTHNYYMGFMGGVISALFTAFAMRNIDKFKWVDKLLELYYNKTIHKYYPAEHDINDLDDFMNYWIKYKEIRLDKFDLNNNNIIYFNERHKLLLSFYPNYNEKTSWKYMATSGLDVCIFTYDCLLITSDIYSFMTLVCIHPGDNDTTGIIGGAWYGALYGLSNFDENRFKELEFYKELSKLMLT